MISSDSSRATTSCSVASTAVASSGASYHDVTNRAEINRPARSSIAKKGTARRPRPSEGQPVPWGGRSFGRLRETCHSVCPEGARAGPQARGSPQGQGRGIIVLDKDAIEGGKTKPCNRTRQARASNALASTALRGCQLQHGGAQDPRTSTLSRPGNQRLRHPAASYAGADQGRSGSAGGTVQMSTSGSAPLRRESSLRYSEKATLASDAAR